MAAAAILKNQNRDVAATVWPIAMKFGRMTQFYTHDASHSYKFVISKIQVGGRRQFEKSEKWNRYISAAVSAI